MKVIKAGHLYELNSMEGTNPQQLQFIKKEPIIQKNHPEYWENGKTPDTGMLLKLHTVADGVTNEEVLIMLIDRINYLNNCVPCDENTQTIIKLKEALMWQEFRTSKRKMQGVESTQIPHKGEREI